jgi:nitronate monooxygenase
MAGAQAGALTVAVCNAGGLGSLPCAMLAPEGIRKELAFIKAHTDRPYNVNFSCHAPPIPDSEREARWRAALAPYYAELGADAHAIPAGGGRAPFGAEAAGILAEFRPAVVSFHFGLPAPRIAGAGESNRGENPVVGNDCRGGALARSAWRGCGYRARGGSGRPPRNVSIGGSNDSGRHLRAAAADRARREGAGDCRRGIADAKGVAAALALGAAGVQVGTAYLLCPEAITGAVHRAALKSEAARHTALTNLFTGRPARGIVNRIMRELGPISGAAPAFPLAAAAIAPLLSKAETERSGDFSPLWSGQNASGCKEIPAGELTNALAAGIGKG